MSRSRFITSAFALVIAVAPLTAASAATISITQFGDQGWRSDDTRDATGADLVGFNTNAPKPGATPTAAHDTAIAQQIQFVQGPAGSTYGGAISMDGTSSNSGKSNISTVSLAGFDAASNLLSTFAAQYQWYGQPNPTSRTLAFKIGVQSTSYGTGPGQSQETFTALRSGESAWDLVLVHVPATSDNAWSTVNVDHDSGNWNLFRQAGNAYFPVPSTTAQTLDAWNTDATFGPLLFGAGAKVTSVQFGLGSSQRQSIGYVDYLQTNLLNNGDVLDFNIPEPSSLALIGGLGLAAIARRRRRLA